MDSELATMFTNELVLVVAAVCALLVWVTRHHAKNHERLTENHFSQYAQFQDELPKLREALQSVAKIAPIIEELQGHLKDMDSEHHAIIETNMDEISLLKKQIVGLQSDLGKTQADLTDTQRRLAVCEVTRGMMAEFLKKNDPELHKQLTETIQKQEV